MEYINKKGVEEQLDNDELSLTNMLLFEIAVQLDKLVEANGK